MNMEFINSLTKKELIEHIISKDAQLQVYIDGNRNLYEYVTSSKFQGFENRNVNPSDIILRLEEIEGNIRRN